MRIIIFLFLFLSVDVFKIAHANQYILDDTKHQQFMKESAQYSLADVMLRITLEYIKKILPPQKSEATLLKQQLWLDEDRNELANALAKNLTEREAFTLATIVRIQQLTALINVEILDASYYNAEKNARFSLSSKNGVSSIHAKSIMDGTPIILEAQGKTIAGWMSLQDKNASELYLLTVKDGAIILDTPSMNNSLNKSSIFSGYYSRIP